MYLASIASKLVSFVQKKTLPEAQRTHGLTVFLLRLPSYETYPNESYLRALSSSRPRGFLELLQSSLASGSTSTSEPHDCFPLEFKCSEKVLPKVYCLRV